MKNQVGRQHSPAPDARALGRAGISIGHQAAPWTTPSDGMLPIPRGGRRLREQGGKVTSRGPYKAVGPRGWCLSSASNSPAPRKELGQGLTARPPGQLCGGFGLFSFGRQTPLGKAEGAGSCRPRSALGGSAHRPMTPQDSRAVGGSWGWLLAVTCVSAPQLLGLRPQWALPLTPPPPSRCWPTSGVTFQRCRPTAG